MKNEIQKAATEHKAKVSRLKADLKALIADLPENPDATRLSKNCCAVNLSSIAKAGGILSASYHVFQSQYQAVIEEAIEKTPIDKLEAKMEEILRKGTIWKRNQGQIKLHPTVIEHLRKAWET